MGEFMKIKTVLSSELNGGEGGIRTLDSGLGYNRLAGGPIRPLWHLPIGRLLSLSHGNYFIVMAGGRGIEPLTLSGDCFQDSVLSQFAYHPEKTSLPAKHSFSTA